MAIRFIRLVRPFLALGAALGLAAVAGFAASAALNAGTQAPTETTTITIPTQTAPAGGAESCPTGSTFGAVRINHPGGHVTIWTCVAQ